MNKKEARNIKDQESLLREKSCEKSAGNNQWTNNNLKYYPDTRERRDGPGGQDRDDE